MDATAFRPMARPRFAFEPNALPKTSDVSFAARAAKA